MPFAEESACDCCVHLMYYSIKLCKTVRVIIINDSHKKHCLIMSILKFNLEFLLYTAAKILRILKKNIHNHTSTKNCTRFEIDIQISVLSNNLLNMLI